MDPPVLSGDNLVMMRSSLVGVGVDSLCFSVFSNKGPVRLNMMRFS